MKSEREAVATSAEEDKGAAERSEAKRSETEKVKSGEGKDAARARA